MGIVAFATFHSGVVGLRIDTGDVVATTGGHIQFGVTADAEVPGAVDGQFLGILRMVQGRTMAIFALNHFVR